jgi:hypothetical protein
MIWAGWDFEDFKTSRSYPVDSSDEFELTVGTDCEDVDTKDDDDPLG